ncbi:hypothetical protein [Mycobacteroides abscessus]|uniref:hypothetical protein n=1 Tax=Mycobacteroides abscessus TaxID=36809 RepID=UPI0009A8EFAA|nr:hypothetical protein [Mycobacteroides abscessus]MBN7314126.1 hypothetical protein [Mycobacteroides abscessus subsp. abscessus]SKG10877.1 Uncharacterised protein [Mycobacteroides abscessus subsp. massiliense]
MGKFVAAGLLGLSGLSLVGEHPLWGVGMLCAAGLLVWMGLQSRQAVRQVHARPTGWAHARQEVQVEVNRAQRQANQQVRQTVALARREAQKNLNAAVERVSAEQAERWVA